MNPIRNLLAPALLALALLGLAAAPSPASPITYALRVTDNAGALVPGATVAVGGTVLTPGVATSVPANAGERVLSTGLAPAGPVSVTLLDYGTGDYGYQYDPALSGEIYFPLSVSKAGSTITGSCALVPEVCSLDSSALLAALASSTANGTALTALPGLLLVTPANKIATATGGGVTLAPADHALIGSQDVPAGLTAQGLTSALITSLAAQVARIYGAEWGSVTPASGGGYSVAMPGGALTIPAPGAAIGTVAPAYDTSGKPTTTTKTVN